MHLVHSSREALHQNQLAFVDFSDYYLSRCKFKRSMFIMGRQKVFTGKQSEQLAELFSKHKEVLLVYLFGSQATGKTTPMSDVDIAILFGESLDSAARFQLRLDLIGKISAILSRDDVDVADLNASSIVLRYQVVKYGKLLYCADTLVKNAFFASTLREYLDTIPMREFYRRKLIEVRKKGISGGRSQRFADAARKADELYRAFEDHSKKGSR